jgi:hypothetical protein
MSQFKTLYSKDLLTGLKRAAISGTVGAPGNITLVAAVTGKIIRVHQVLVASTAGVSIKFQSGTGGTDLTGAIPLAANGGFSADFNPVGHFQTASATLLNLNISGAATVGGWLVYSEVS